MSFFLLERLGMRQVATLKESARKKSRLKLYHYPLFPKISAFPVQRSELPAGPGKFLQRGSHLGQGGRDFSDVDPPASIVLRFYLLFALLQARLQSPGKGPLGPTVGSELGKTKLAIRSAMAAVGASRQMSQLWLGG